MTIEETQELTNRVREVLVEYMGITLEELTDEKDLENDLGADSLDIVEICMLLERIFDIEITDSGLEKIKTVKDFVDTVIEAVTTKPPKAKKK